MWSKIFHIYSVLWLNLFWVNMVTCMDGPVQCWGPNQGWRHSCKKTVYPTTEKWWKRKATRYLKFVLYTIITIITVKIDLHQMENSLLVFISIVFVEYGSLLVVSSMCSVPANIVIIKGCIVDSKAVVCCVMYSHKICLAP